MDKCEQLAEALITAASEHGVPNKFTPGELASRYGAPWVLDIGRIISAQRIALDALLRPHGIRVSSYAADGGGRKWIGVAPVEKSTRDYDASG